MKETGHPATIQERAYSCLRLVVIKFCGLMGFSLAAIHAVLALSIWTPAYFAKYFDEVGRLNLQGEIAMATGVVSLFFLSLPAITTLPMMPKALGGQRWKRSQRMGYVALVLVAVHLLALGLKGWLKPKAWPAGMERGWPHRITRPARTPD